MRLNKFFSSIIFCGLLNAIPAHAESTKQVAMVIRSIKSQGFEITNVTRTFFGRIRIISSDRGIQREIVMNPNTGEILQENKSKKTSPTRYGAPIKSDDAEDRQGQSNTSTRTARVSAPQSPAKGASVTASNTTGERNDTRQTAAVQSTPEPKQDAPASKAEAPAEPVSKPEPPTRSYGYATTTLSNGETFTSRYGQ